MSTAAISEARREPAPSFEFCVLPSTQTPDLLDVQVGELQSAMARIDTRSYQKRKSLRRDGVRRSGDSELPREMVRFGTRHVLRTNTH